ncbi:hypothetical protein J3F83DRAFT_770573 [Trichoderma novae-zelandiae]
MASSEPYTAPLREENLVLGHLLGYRHEAIRDSRGTLLPEKLRDIPSLPGFPMRDVVFVSVDIGPRCDSGISLPRYMCFGISILDTRSFTRPIATDGEAKAAIQSYQYVTGESDTCDWSTEGFRFGETSLVELPEVVRKFARLTQDRRYILVGQEPKRDCEFLKLLDWKITERAGYELAIAKAAQYPLQSGFRCSLHHTLQAFGIKGRGLGGAGNRAHLALRAMLLLTVRDWEMAVDTFTDADRKLKRSLRRVATHELLSTETASAKISTELPLANAPDREDEREDEREDDEESWVILPVGLHDSDS